MIQLSVLIPTRNRAEILDSLLKSIENQTLDQSLFEVIVCDNNSTDNTADIVNIFTDKFQNYEYIQTITPGLHIGRHAGARHAHSDLLVYLDDDIIAAPGWLKAVGEAFQDPEVQLVGGRSLPQYEGEPPDWLEAFWDHSSNGQNNCGYLSLIDLGDKSFQMDPNNVWGLNFAIRKQALEALGGFNPDSMPWELRRYRGDGESAVTRKAKALGMKAVYQPAALVYHQVPKSRLTIDYFERRAFLQGISDSFTDIRANGGKISSAASPTRMNWKAPLRMVKRRIDMILKSKKPIPADPYQVIKDQITAAHNAGYQYHQDEVRDDPVLLEWVLKPDYWDGRIPPLPNTATQQKGEPE